MKPEIDHPDKVSPWIQNPEPAVFQGLNLVAASDELSQAPLTGCVFLGCTLGTSLAQAAAAAQCFVMPVAAGLRFDPYSPGLYTPSELYDKFDPDASDPGSTYRACLDWLVFDSVIDPVTKKERPVDVDVVLMRRIHDASISDALGDLLDARDRNKCVAIMGGHDRGRDEAIYLDTAKLALELAQAGYLVVTGGGPGLMEAGSRLGIEHGGRSALPLHPPRARASVFPLGSTATSRQMSLRHSLPSTSKTACVKRVFWR